jgi:uncharacterized protein (DUF427 family)
MTNAGRSAAASGQTTTMARATWNGLALAETSHPVLPQGNVYFPPGDARHEHLATTRAWPLCGWKGRGAVLHRPRRRQVNQNAAWYYPHHRPPARKIKNHVAFWHGSRPAPGQAIIVFEDTHRAGSEQGQDTTMECECNERSEYQRGQP